MGQYMAVQNHRELHSYGRMPARWHNNDSVIKEVSKSMHCEARESNGDVVVIVNLYLAAGLPGDLHLRRGQRARIKLYVTKRETARSRQTNSKGTPY